MKPPPFAYARAGSLPEALELLAQAGPDAKLLAGGQSLLPLLVYRIVRPSHLIDVDGVAGLDGIEIRDGEIELGALVRHARLERARLPGGARLLAEAAGEIGHVPIRARGTLGGSLAHADPAAELPVACIALDARVVVRSSTGRREVDAESFFVGPFTTALGEGEAITALRVPVPAERTAGAFREHALRVGDFALASVAVLRVLDDDGVTVRARVALGGIAATPIRAGEAEALLEGERLTPARAAEAGHAATAVCEGPDDSDGRHRRELVAVLVRDALLAGAGEGSA